MTVKRAIRKCLTAPLLLAVLLSSCAGSGENAGAGGYGHFIELAGYEATENGFTRSYTDGERTLLLNEATAEIAVVDNVSGKTWYSNPQGRENDSIATDENIEILGSQLFIDYQNPLYQKSTYYSSRDSVRLGNYQVEEIDRGFQVTYLLGVEDPERGIPKALTTAGYEALLARFEDEKDRAELSRRYSLVKLSVLQEGSAKQALLEQFPLLESENLYILRDGNTSVYSRLRALLESAGYTEEELERDESAAGYVETEEMVQFQVGIRYELAEEGLLVTVPLDAIAMPAGYTITSISVLPYFASQGIEAAGEILLPDGSGSIIRINNGKTGASPYEAVVYGGDIGNYERAKTYDPRVAHLPVFGISGQDSAVFAVIESGASTATLHAMVSGMRSENNNAYVSFTTAAAENYQMGNTVGAEIDFLDSRFAAEDMSIRYMLLDEPADYSQMAQIYRQYLIDTGGLAEREEPSGYKAYLGLTGAVTNSASFLGIPYQEIIPLTTFAEAGKILQALDENGVDSLAVRYTGWNEGGVRQGLPSEIRPESRLGGEEAFQAFVEDCLARDIPLFLNYNFQTVSKSDGLFDNFRKSSHAARTITGKYGLYVSRYRSDLYMPLERQMVIKPSLYAGFSRMAAEELAAYGLTGVSLERLGSRLAADYDENSYTSLPQSVGLVEDALDILTGNHIRILSQGVNDYAFSNVTDVVELETACAEYAITDYAVPFIQMVLAGCMDYAGSAINYDDFQVNFLKALETGSLLYIDLMYAENSVLSHMENLDTYYTSCYRGWIDSFSEAYRELAAVYEELGSRIIVAHRRLADKVFAATYRGGRQVLINYSDAAYTWEGITVPANGYMVV